MMEDDSMEILFTTTNLITSRLIKKITKEPVSHCAIRIGAFVIHSNFKGVIIEPYSVFIRANQVIYKISGLTYPIKIDRTLRKHYGKSYDFGALFFLGLRYLCPKLVSKQNLWQSTGMFLCTEFVTQFLDEKENSLITPYKLYLKLNPLNGEL